MIAYSRTFDQQTMIHMLEHDPIVQRYRTFFAFFDWSVVPEPILDPSQPGKRPHPQATYIKALLLKLEEGLSYCTRLRRFLVEHPLLVLELGFRPVLNVELPYGFDVERTVPTARWFSEQQRTLSRGVLHTLLLRTVEALRDEIPGLGARRLLATSTDPVYGDVILAEYTQPFNEGDITHFFPLYVQTVASLGCFPTHLAADAAFDAWYCYQGTASRQGIAALPLNSHGHPHSRRDSDGVALCAKGRRMVPTFQFSHT